MTFLGFDPSIPLARVAATQIDLDATVIVRDDGSFLDRMEGYQGAFAGFVNEPYGYGMGAAPAQNLEPGASLGLSHDGQSVPLGDSNSQVMFLGLWYADKLIRTSEGWRMTERVEESGYVHNVPGGLKVSEG